MITSTIWVVFWKKKKSFWGVLHNIISQILTISPRTPWFSGPLENHLGDTGWPHKDSWKNHSIGLGYPIIYEHIDFLEQIHRYDIDMVWYGGKKDQCWILGLLSLSMYIYIYYIIYSSVIPIPIPMFPTLLSQKTPSLASETRRNKRPKKIRLRQ